MDSFKLSEPQVYIFYGSEQEGRFRIFPKGRRLGATRGGSVAFIDWMCQGKACLWGDTINSNIDRYVERYFEPFLRSNRIKYKWNSVKKVLKVGSGYTDFRSADKPENWEGFGYDYVFLNEAGIILNNSYIYTNAVLPMLIDNPNSQLIASGTPKLLRGKGKQFYKLWQKVERKEKGYCGKQYSTYDNPFLTRAQIADLEKEIPANERRQEIYGDFILQGGSIVSLEWFKRYKALPEHPVRIIQSWDTGSKLKEINDPSVCTTWLETNRAFYLADVYRKKLEYPNLKRAVKSLAEKWKPNIILIEDKSSGISLIQDLRGDRFPYNIKSIEPHADKVTRMSTASLTIEAGRVFLPESAPWLTVFEDEICAFPMADHDDQTDSVSQFLNWVRSSIEILIG